MQDYHGIARERSRAQSESVSPIWRDLSRGRRTWLCTCPRAVSVQGFLARYRGTSLSTWVLRSVQGYLARGTVSVRGYLARGTISIQGYLAHRKPPSRRCPAPCLSPIVAGRERMRNRVCVCVREGGREREREGERGTRKREKEIRPSPPTPCTSKPTATS